MMGVDAFDAVLNPPEAALLARFLADLQDLMSNWERCGVEGGHDLLSVSSHLISYRCTNCGAVRTPRHVAMWPGKTFGRRARRPGTGGVS